MKLLNFNFKKNSITTLIDKNQEIWFIASDVCRTLGHSNTSQMVKDNCTEEGISTAYTLTASGKQNALIINEQNLYRLIFKSRKEFAKKFQNWIFEEVLPSIRKTGKYSIPEKLKEKSTKNRNLLTDEWKRHGIKKPNEYIGLTLKEYRELNFKEGKRKKDFNRGELLLLNALESMEMLKLFNNEEIDGYIKCSKSIETTAHNVKVGAGTKKGTLA